MNPHSHPSLPRIAAGPTRRCVSALIGSLLLLSALPALPALPVLPALSEPAARYRKVPASRDGIGRVYTGREIAGVMGWQGAAWLEREEREREERTDLLVRALQLEPGMTVADIGAGTGYLARRMAPRVLPGGRVLAVDVQPQMVRLLRAAAEREGLSNIQATLGAEDDVRLPAGSIDLAVMVDVYHELSLPFEVLASIARALKPGGRVAFVEYRAEDPAVPIKALHKTSAAQVRKEAEVHGLVEDRSFDGLPWQHLLLFRKPAATG